MPHPYRAVAHEVRRGMLRQVVDAHLVGNPPPPAPTVVAANHPGVLDAPVLVATWPQLLAMSGVRGRLRRGRSALVFPEVGVSPDGSLGAFQPDAFEAIVGAWRREQPATVTPVAISGTFGLKRQLPGWRAHADKAQVFVRVGEPIRPHHTTPDALAERVRDAVAALLAEDTSTWWRLIRGEAAVEPAGRPSWRHAWAATSGELPPGIPARRKIWR